MDLSKIRYFFTMAEMENVTRAARACHLAQTSMSKYISSLEKEIGTNLFDRHKNRLILNENGKRFYVQMKQIDSEYQALCNMLRERKNDRLTIGVVTSDYTQFDLIEDFEQSQDDVQVFFTFVPEEQAASRLESGALDALIAPDVLNLCSQNPQSLQATELARTPVGLICSSSLYREAGSAEELIRHGTFITKTDQAFYHQKCQDALEEQFGICFEKIQVVASYSEQILLVAMGKGFAILPDSLVPGMNNLECVANCPRLAETQQLIYPISSHSAVLERLLKYIHEKKC